MKRTIIETEDGSKTIYIEGLDETYHSKHGAVQEANHVFIQHGFQFFENKQYKSLKILEIGLGSGLNAFLTLLEAERNSTEINYVGVEKYPVSFEEFEALDYFDSIFRLYPEFEERKPEFETYFQNLFQAEWEKEVEISAHFKIKKIKKDFFDLTKNDGENFDLVYFDAFGSKVQPELWEENLLSIVASLTKDTSIVSTYAAKGSFKRALKSLGFIVKKFPGPPGKREMMVAFKNFDYE